MVVSVAAVVCGVPAEALEWRHSHGATASVNSDSNVGRGADDSKPARSAGLSVNADVTALRPGMSFWLRPEVTAQRYADDAAADRNDVVADTGLTLGTRRGQLSLGANYARDSTLTNDT